MTCDCEAPAVFDDTVRAARREHQCVECGRTVMPGGRYHAIRGLWDGSWSAYAVCIPCQALRLLSERLGDGCDCIAFGALFDTLREEQRLVKRISATRCETEGEAASIGATLGHLYGVFHADADEEHEATRIWLRAKAALVGAEVACG